MSTSVPTVAESYELLSEIAGLIGLNQHVKLLEQRTRRYTAPLTLGVVGIPEAGLAPVVDILLGRTLAGALPSGTWVSSFTAAAEVSEAELHYADGTTERLPVEVATVRLSAAEGIVRVVWHCANVQLPDNVRVDVRTVTPPYTSMASWLQDMDAVIVALPVTRMPVALPMLDALLDQCAYPIPVMGVVTGMSQIPEDMWNEVMRRLRNRLGDRLEHLIPLGESDNVEEHPPKGSTALMRTVRLQIFSAGKALRTRVDEQFVRQVEEQICTETERYVDRLIIGYGYWKKEWARIEHDLEQRRVYALEQGDLFIQQLQSHAEERARLMEKGLVPPHPPVLDEAAIRDFLGGVQGQFISVGTRRLERMTEVLGRDLPKPARKVDTRDYLRHLYHLLPQPPVEVLRLLTQPVRPLEPVEAASFVEGKGTLHPPVEAVRWEHGVEWVRKVAEQVRQVFRRWVLGLYDRVREQLRLQSGKLFRFFFHTDPEHAADHVLRVEQLYERLKGQSVRIPAPHLGVWKGLSPAEFLLKTQDEDFVRAWNRSWKQHCWKETSHAVYRWGRDRLRAYREALREEWQNSWDVLRTYVLQYWHREGLRALFRGETRWSFQDVLAQVFKNRTPVPEEDLRMPPFKLSAQGLPFWTLWIREDARYFLEKQADPEVQQVNRMLQQRLESIWKRHLMRLSRQDFQIRLVLPLRKWFIAGGAGLTLSFLALLFLGMHPGIAFLLLMALSVGALAAIWLLPEIMEEKGYALLATQQAEKLHQVVERLLRDMLARVEQEALNELKQPDMEARVLEAIPEDPPRVFRLPYATVRQRLSHLSAAA